MEELHKSRIDRIDETNSFDKDSADNGSGRVGQQCVEQTMQTRRDLKRNECTKHKLQSILCAAGECGQF